MEKKNFILVGIGEILWDLFPGGKKLGGAPANFAYHAGALGGEGIVVSRVGADEPGKEILDVLSAHGLGSRYVTMDDFYPTGSVSVVLEKGGEPDYVIHENVAWDHMPHSEELLTLAAGTDAVCFGTLCQRSPVSRKTIHEFLHATRPDCIRVFDINLRQSFYDKEIIEESLGSATVLKLNDKEVDIVGDVLGIDGSDSHVMGELSGRYGLELIALTKGRNGSSLYLQEKSYDHGGFEVDVADTVGAGDAFTAAMTLGWLRRKSPDEINEYANRVASYVCTQAGAMPPIPEHLIGV